MKILLFLFILTSPIILKGQGQELYVTRLSNEKGESMDIDIKFNITSSLITIYYSNPGTNYSEVFNIKKFNVLKISDESIKEGFYNKTYICDDGYFFIVATKPGVSPFVLQFKKNHDDEWKLFGYLPTQRY